ncbi:hypothetical protein GCM10010168_26910 [Actinoplanes ianthinogenes]|uniref:Uncharacterized protein n=1 Tax=Actinoplanes ianthinogenes TaxID=122358 RepID=A0ABM7LKP5_9ACTN|nr:hypothetical protein [Actinoplanes ianthinogenes]BCJ39831.1 hypothetical protein Aiant_04880 [Actinoplanes ianthinogenes]GGR08441.1 hypothetical protein GCM10010168_26910 [Actinoplanes ianthinogenes]
MVDIEVRARVTGRSGDLPAVLVRLEQERTTARELIRRAVEEQIRLLDADAAHCRQMLDQHYLSDADIREQAATGTVRWPARSAGAPDPEIEVTRAQRAFERGTFAIFAGGRQLSGLDAEVTVRLGEPVVFLRLVALVGG